MILPTDELRIGNDTSFVVENFSMFFSCPAKHKPDVRVVNISRKAQVIHNNSPLIRDDPRLSFFDFLRFFKIMIITFENLLLLHTTPGYLLNIVIYW